jgi:hypothetical protein
VIRQFIPPLNTEVAIDEIDADLLDTWGSKSWFMPKDLRQRVAERMILPDYINLVSIDGDMTNCCRENIAARPVEKITDRMYLHPGIGFSIYVRGKSGPHQTVQVSPEDYDYVTKWSWFIHASSGYVVRRAPMPHGTRWVSLHRLIAQRMGYCNDSIYVHFINGNKLNCERSNLAMGGAGRKRVFSASPDMKRYKKTLQRLLNK